MKRIYIILIAALTLAISCEKTDSGQSLNSFTAETDNDGWLWKSGDAIRVSNGRDIADYLYDESKGLFIADKPLDNTDMLQAVFPADIAVFSEGKLLISLPEEQTAVKEDDLRLPLYLWKAKDGVLRFKGLLGGVKLSLSGSGTALYESSLVDVEFHSTGNPVCGNASVGTDGNLAFEKSSKTLRILCPDGYNVRSNVCFMLPAQKYPMGSRITFHFADGKTIESETIMGIVPRRGTIKAYEIEITSDFFGPLEEYGEGGSIDDKF